MSKPNNDAGMPIALTLEAGTYFRCTCGKSQNLPFCDGAHQPGDTVQIRFQQPFCDGTCRVAGLAD